MTYSSAGRAVVDRAIVGADLAAREGAAAEHQLSVARGRDDLGESRGGAGIDLGDGDRGLSRSCGASSDGNHIRGALGHSEGEGGHADSNSKDGLDGELHFVFWLV